MAGSHYFDHSPEGPSREQTVRLLTPTAQLDLTSDRGVFSADRVDTGTKLLIVDGPTPPPSGVFLDLGCGYGAIASWLATRAPEATVWAVDVNERALALCRRNGERLGLGQLRVCRPQEVPADIRFDQIWSNPPIRIGKPALHELLTTWLDRLTPAGSGHLVVQKHLGADSLATWLDKEGWSTTRRASRAGYRLLDVGPRAQRPPT